MGTETKQIIARNEIRWIRRLATYHHIQQTDRYPMQLIVEHTEQFDL